MGHKSYNEETVDFQSCIEFVKRRKYTIAVTILLFLGAGYFFTVSVPETYKVSISLSGPPGETLRHMRNRVNRRLYDEETVKMLEDLSARADFMRNSGILIESPEVSPDNVNEKKELLAQLTDRLILYYEDKEKEEKKRIEGLIRQIKENEGEKQAGDKYYRIDSLRLKASRITNIKVISGPRAEKNPAPSTGLNLSLAGIAGLYLGIVFGIIEDIILKQKEAGNAESKH